MSLGEGSLEFEVKVLELGVCWGKVLNTQRSKSVNLSQDNLLQKGGLQAGRLSEVGILHTASVRT